MKKNRLITALGLSAALFSTTSAFAAEALSPEQKAEVQQLIGSYLKENPEVVIDAIQAWRQKQDAAEAAMVKEAVTELMAESKDTRSPVLGNPKGDVTIVEFFDYNCPYCKKVFPGIKKLLADDGNIRIVMKELPVLGPNSEYAAKAALAAQKQGKYEAFHEQMMSEGSRLSRDGVLAAAEKVGLDTQQLQKDMETADVQRELEQASMWAQRLGVNGTPAFVIGDQLIPGAIDSGRMKQLVDKARAAK